MKRTALIITAAAALIAGCQSHSKSSKAKATEPMVIEQASITPEPTIGALTPEAVEPTGMLPVAQGPKLRRVFLAPYKDENGNAYGPQIKYVVDQPFDWNMEAIANPARAYIPPELTTSPQRPGAITVPNTGQEIKPERVKTVRELYHIENVEVTGYVERSQEPLAREMAARKGDGSIPYFDENLGWLLIPASALQSAF